MRGAACAVLIVLAAPVPAPAQTECPTAGDLAAGVDLVRLDPFYASSFRRAGTTMTETRVVGVGTEAQTITARYTHGLLNVEQDSPAGLLQVVYFEQAGPLDTLPEIGVWRSVVNLSWNGDFVGEGLYSAVYVESVPWEVGACIYETWYVQETLNVDGLDPIFVDKYYAPGLGLVIAAVEVAGDGEPIGNVVYDTVSAR